MCRLLLHISFKLANSFLCASEFVQVTKENQVLKQKVGKRFRNSILDCKTYSETDVDNNLVVMKCRNADCNLKRSESEGKTRNRIQRCRKIVNTWKSSGNCNRKILKK